jgi:signal transduction histidine kinase/integral membrane sensor domain MASE1
MSAFATGTAGSTSVHRRNAVWLPIAEIARNPAPLIWLIVGVLVSLGYNAVLWPLFTFTLPLPLFPPQAVVLSVLLLTPTRHWWLYLVVYYLLLVAQGLWVNPLVMYTLSSDVGDVIEPLIGAALVRRFVPRTDPFTQLRDVSVYAACVTVASAVGAIWGATARLERGFSFWQSWQGWFLSDVVASLILAPMIMLWAMHGFTGVRSASRRRLFEAALLGLASLVIGWLIFTAKPDNPDAAPALLYLPVPILVWAAVRFGPQGLVTALAAVTLMAVVGAANGLGPFVGRSAPADILTLRLFLLGVGMPLFLLAALVSERQRAQVKLAQSEERYRLMVRSLPHAAVLLFGPDLRHEFADGQGLADFGLTKATTEGRTPSQAFPPEIAEVLEPGYRSALLGRHGSSELTHDSRQYQIYSEPIADAMRPTGMLVLHDVTDQKRAEALADLDRAKSAFFNSVSHELRTPLTLVFGPVHDALARGGTLGGDALRMVYRNTLRLQRLVNALLDFSRIEAGRLHPRYELTRLETLTAELASNFRPIVESAGLKLVVDTPPLPPDMPIYVDRGMWEKVVLNLVSNAFNHTFEGEIGVLLHPSEDRRRVELAVADTGIGIPLLEQSQIFERFHRVEGVRSRNQTGTGIGLALVQEFVQLHEGTVTVHSVEGQGSVFTVSLPVRIPPTAEGRAGMEEGTSSPVNGVEPLLEEMLDRVHTAGSAQVRAGLPRPAGHVLVADDNPDMRRYIATALEDEWTVDTVSDGRSTLRAIRDKLPDAVVLDVMMPEMNGFEVLSALHADPQTSVVPVIMLSARAGDEAAVEGLLAGASDYVVKPFSTTELSARVRTQVEASRARSRAEAALKARDDFVALVSHDLRLPLVAMYWQVQALRRYFRPGAQVISDEVVSMLESVEAGTASLSRQIDELQDATRLQSSHPLDLRRTPVDLVELAGSIVRHHESTSERSRFRFEKAAKALNGIWDAARLERVIANLISNAVKYGGAGEINVRVSRDASWAVLSVQDHGVGIPAADLPHTFERYWRGNNVRREIAGAGLGLAGARGIIEQHDGTLTVESVEGEGSMFTIRLPMADEDKPNNAGSEAT